MNHADVTLARPKIARASLLTLVLVLVAAGCSSSDNGGAAEAGGDDPPAEATQAPTTTAAPTTTTTEPPPPTLFVERGPYEVGVVTIDLGDRLAEVYYPADPDPSAATEIFDTLDVFPEALRPLIPPEISGLVETNAFRDAVPTADVPADGFPILVYSHGFGGFRQVATVYTTHVASWGYVVVSTDHLERGLAARALGTIGEGPEDQDLVDVFNSIDGVIGDDRLAPIVDAERIVITGHSAGAGTSARAAADERIDAYISISGGAPDVVVQKPAMVIISELDAVVPPERSYDLFDQLNDAVLINIADGGHNSFTDSCRAIRDLGGLDSLAALIGEDQVAQAEDGCVEPFIEPEATLAVLNHYTVRFLVGLFGDGTLENPMTDVSSLLVVDDVDEGDSGPVQVEFADFQAR